MLHLRNDTKNRSRLDHTDIFGETPAMDGDQIKNAAELLAKGELVAFPTETVYGLGADATNAIAVAKIFEAKNRPSFNPLISHVAEVAQVRRYGVMTELAEKLADAFWPGPMTLVLRRSDGCPVADLACAGLPTLALRVPAHPIAHDLLTAFGGPVVAPSANPSGSISPTTADHVRDGLGSSVSMILDGGPCDVGLESTIIDASGENPVLLRPGGISLEQIEEVVGPVQTADHNAKISAPGMMKSHYAPDASVRLNAAEQADGEAYLGFGGYDGAGSTLNLSEAGDIREAAANLFAMMRELDRSGAKAIAVAPIPMTGLGLAINDRLARAAAPRD